ncbi:MAG: FixH family protein [bacterium]
MKISRKYSTLVLVGIISAFVLLVSACGEKNTTEPEHGHTLVVEMSYTPNPATANTAIHFLFETEDDGEHVAVTGIDVEVEKEGTGNHVEIEVTPEAGEVGHYEGEYTFTEAGNYELHFNGMHDNEPFEKEFSITVQ